MNDKNNCSVVALTTISGLPYKQVLSLLLSHGYDPAQGIQPAPISLAAEKLGFKWSVKGTKEAKGKTPSQIAQEGWNGTWLLFCKDHVIPLVNGHPSNLCGYGNEPVQFVMQLIKDVDNFKDFVKGS